MTAPTIGALFAGYDGLEIAVSDLGAWRHARQPLDPTPPGPPIAGEQPDLLEMLGEVS